MATVDVAEVWVETGKPAILATVDIAEIWMDTLLSGSPGTATVDVSDLALDIIGPNNPTNQLASVDIADIWLTTLPGGPVSAAKTGMYIYLGGVLTPIGIYTQ